MYSIGLVMLPVGFEFKKREHNPLRLTYGDDLEMTAKRLIVRDGDYAWIDTTTGYVVEVEDAFDLINQLHEEKEELENKIDVLEDDNETYHKSLEKLNLYTKRFIPTKCTNEFKDCKTNRYYWLDHEGNFEGCLELLNLLDCENEVLKSENRQLKGRLMEYEEQIKGDVE